MIATLPIRTATSVGAQVAPQRGPTLRTGAFNITVTKHTFIGIFVFGKQSFSPSLGGGNFQLSRGVIFLLSLAFCLENQI